MLEDLTGDSSRHVLFLIFNDNPPDVIGSRLGVNADDRGIYSLL